MPRYIDADAFEVSAHERYCAECDNYAGLKCRACWVDDMLGDVAEAPTITPDEVRGVGEWISERDGSIVELDEDGYVTDSCHCSVCNEHLDGSEEYAVKGNYCPNCGARMKGEQ